MVTPRSDGVDDDDDDDVDRDWASDEGGAAAARAALFSFLTKPRSVGVVSLQLSVPDEGTARPLLALRPGGTILTSPE